MDAITLLKNDHRNVNAIFKKFERAGDSAYKTKQKLVAEMIRELSVHAAAEETAFYPFVKGVNDSITDDVLESLEEHHVVKWLLSELEGMSAKEERYDAKVTVLIENVRHHVQDEEQELFPLVRKALSRQQLQELGDLLARAKKTVPTRPHPRAADEPPGNMVSGMVSGFIDRVRDTARDAAKTTKKQVARTPARTGSTRSSGARTAKRTARRTTARSR